MTLKNNIKRKINPDCIESCWEKHGLDLALMYIFCFDFDSNPR